MQVKLIKVDIFQCIFLNWILFFAFACNSEPKRATVPVYFNEIENLTIFSGNPSPIAEINFEREISIGDSPDPPLGRLGRFTVDDLGRIYISDSQQSAVHLFDPHGAYITSIGRGGSGPGEYTGPPYPTVKSDQLFILDPMRLLMDIYSADDFDLIKTINLNPTNKGSFEGLFDTQVNQIMIIDEATYLVTMSTFIPRVPEDAGELMDDRSIYFYLMGDDGRLLKPLIEPVPLFELTGRSTSEMARYTGPYSRAAPSPQLFAKPLIAVSDIGDIFVAMSDHLLIRKYAADGDYQSAFYHPFEHLEMNRESAIHSQGTPFLADLVSQNEIPDTWPALDRLLVDDEGRLWIATIVDDFDIYEWWVLDESGDLITTFEWPRDETIVTFKNGKMYTRETDGETGLQQVVRYKINLTEMN